MKLYHSPTSPYVRKVMITAHELGLVDQIELVAGTGTPLAPNDEVVGANPVGRIPALVTADQDTLMDSRVICRYLDHIGGGDLYGAAGDFALLAREALADGITDSGLLAAYEGRLRPPEMQFAPWVDGQRAKVMRGLTAFDARVGELSADISMDQIALAACCGYIDFRHGDLGWRDACPALAGWFARISERPSLQATQPS